MIIEVTETILPENKLPVAGIVFMSQKIVCKVGNKRNMVAVLRPVIIVSNFHGLKSGYHVSRGKTVVKMVGFVFVPVQVMCRMLFFALDLFVMLMVSTIYSFL
jgi:hypothetical protein